MFTSSLQEIAKFEAGCDGCDVHQADDLMMLDDCAYSERAVQSYSDNGLNMTQWTLTFLSYF
jgi:hypothetical protein